MRAAQINAIVQRDPKNQWTPKKETELLTLGLTRHQAEELFEMVKIKKIEQEAKKYTGFTRLQFLAERHPDPEVRAGARAALDG